jgi:hypothetical protein
MTVPGPTFAPSVYRDYDSPLWFSYKDNLPRYELESLPFPIGPRLCGRVGSVGHAGCEAGVNPLLHAAYAAWIEHHAECGTCVREDWYMPGGIQFVDDHLLAEFVLELEGYPPLFARRAPDLSVLCEQGADLFGRWVFTTLNFAR